MEEKKMNGYEFVDKLREQAKKTTLASAYFVIVGQENDADVETTSIVMVKQNGKKVLCAFNYDTNGIIYNLTFGDISMVELCELTDLVKNTLDNYNF